MGGGLELQGLWYRVLRVQGLGFRVTLSCVESSRFKSAALGSGSAGQPSSRL